MAKQLSLIVATYNRADKVTITLESIAKQDASPTIWECIVVNNNSKDNTIEVVNKFIEEHPDIDIKLVTELTQGLSAARNCGIDRSSAPIIAIIDDDEIIVPQLISSYIDLFERYPQAAAAGGAIIPQYISQHPKWISKYTEIPIANPLNLGSTPRRFPKGKIPGGGNMAIRRSVIDRIGAFDPKLGRNGEQLIGGEESNLFERIERAGLETWWTPEAIMYHLIPDTKLELSYLTKLWFNIGVSQLRRSAIESRPIYKVLFNESLKWGATLALASIYTLTLRPSKGWYLLLMRYYISSGIKSAL